jgi:hypothetical protein
MRRGCVGSSTWYRRSADHTVYRDIGYELLEAVVDSVGISVATGATMVKLDLYFDGTDSWIRIEVDRSGLGRRTPIESLQYGLPLGFGCDDFGKFGFGLTSASSLQCRQAMVASRRAVEARIEVLALAHIKKKSLVECAAALDEHSESRAESSRRLSQRGYRPTSGGEGGFETVDFIVAYRAVDEGVCATAHHFPRLARASYPGGLVTSRRRGNVIRRPGGRNFLATGRSRREKQCDSTVSASSAATL